MSLTYSFFPKMLAHLPADELGEFTRSAGLDTVNAVVRDGYWTRPDRVCEDVPRFIEALGSSGISPHFATCKWDPHELLELDGRDETIACLAEHGITDLRLAQYMSGGGYGEVGDVREELALARDELARLAELGRHLGVRFVYQTHHMTLVSSASALSALLAGLDPQSLGAMMDGGNQNIEGFENPTKASRLLADHLCAIGVKDSLWERSTEITDHSKGWKPRMVPVYEGMTNWRTTIAAVLETNPESTLVFMPLYRITDPDELLPVLKREVAYIRSIESEIQGGST